MDEELKENEDLESIFQEIRDIVGTKNLDEIVDFIMNRNKRYNYACQEIEDCEKMNKKLKKEIKFLKENLVSLKNNLLVKENTDQKELEIDLTTNPEDEIKIIQIEKEKNKNLLELGKKYNEVEKAYQLVMQNITSMVETERQNPLNVQLDKETSQNNFELTNDELKNYEETEVNKEEIGDLDKYELNEEEKKIVDGIKELNEKDIYELEKNRISYIK
jgi:predicted patatin/cPLA2 family phospholipase